MLEARSVVGWRPRMYRRLRYALVAAAAFTALSGFASHGAKRPIGILARSVEIAEVSTPRSEPLKLPNSALEPIDASNRGDVGLHKHGSCAGRYTVPRT
jgi:hypothetical protein